MKRLFTALAIASAFLGGCAVDGSPHDETAGFDYLLRQSDNYGKVQEYELATDYALKAIEVADSKGNRQQRAEGLCLLAGIDLLTWRDEQAWSHALEAESIAREEHIDSTLAKALMQKGRVCAYGGITQAETRDDEALEYFTEAMQLAEKSNVPRLKVDIFYHISQVYVNKNRFNDTNLNPQWYALAGEYLEKGERLALLHGFTDMRAKALIYKMRYLRQGGRIKEGIKCCTDLLAICSEKDWLNKSQAYNQLVMLHALDGNTQEAAAMHQQYVYCIEYYMQQKADSKL
ncbi:MAG: hypothetical protein IJ795_00250 [Bacteroidales bacterium]|nr:hypothetical protein [Bacteroidales bacterium]